MNVIPNTMIFIWQIQWSLFGKCTIMSFKHTIIRFIKMTFTIYVWEYVQKLCPYTAVDMLEDLFTD